jgi:hypothetical protein
MIRILALLLCLLAVRSQAQPPPPVPGPSWVPKAGAQLNGLDKITARLTPLSGKAGETISFRTLKITVRSCQVRGPDQPADSAAFLDVIDTAAPGFAFHGWMVLSNPALAVLEHPVYDVKLLGCTP